MEYNKNNGKYTTIDEEISTEYLENNDLEELIDESRDDIILPSNITIEIPELTYLQKMLRPYRSKERGNLK